MNVFRRRVPHLKPLSKGNLIFRHAAWFQLKSVFLGDYLTYLARTHLIFAIKIARTLPLRYGSDISDRSI